jgi:hypothetical protein
MNSLSITSLISKKSIGNSNPNKNNLQKNTQPVEK